VGRALRDAVLNFFKDGGPDLAAAGAFYTILSLPPLLYLTGAALAWVFGAGATHEAAFGTLDRLLPHEVAAWIRGLDLGVDSPGLVLVALPALLLAASRGFTALGRALNVAFGVRRRRANWLARVKGLGLMLAWFAFLVLSVAFGTLVPRFTGLLSRLGRPELSDLFAGVTAWFFAPAVSLVTFVLFYRLLPYVRVGWRPALYGAVLACLAWEGARRVFAQLLAASATLGLVSGAVAGTIALLLWVYTMVGIVLLGAEFTAVLDGHRGEEGAAAGSA
jgi:membrane protein